MTKSALVATLLHELLELFGEVCWIHQRDAKFFDPAGMRNAVRQAQWQIEYLGAKDVFEIADIAMERRVPPGRTAKSRTELRKHCGIKGVVNPPSELQAIWQALPKRYWLSEQMIWFKKVKRWLKKQFPDAVGLVTLHTDKNRVHIEYVLLKYGADRKLLPCFKGFKHDGPGVSGNRATAAIKGRKFTSVERSKMKINSVSAIDWAVAMRKRLLKYLREMGPGLRRKCLTKARIVYGDLEKNMFEKSKRRRAKLCKLDAARTEFKQLLEASGEDQDIAPEAFKPVSRFNKSGWRTPEPEVLQNAEPTGAESAPMNESKLDIANAEFEIKPPAAKPESPVAESVSAKPEPVINEDPFPETVEQPSAIGSSQGATLGYYDFKLMVQCDSPSETTLPLVEFTQFQKWMKEVGLKRHCNDPNESIENMSIRLLRIYRTSKHMEEPKLKQKTPEPPTVN